MEYNQHGYKEYETTSLTYSAEKQKIELLVNVAFVMTKKNKINQNNLEVWFNKAWKIFLEDESFIDFVSFNIFAGKMLTKWKCVAISSNICISFASICFLTI